MKSDLRDAFRSLTRDRGFACVAVVLLALTGGATTAVYAVVDAVLLQPMALRSQERTVVIWQRDSARGTPVVEVALGEVGKWREHATSFDALGVFGSVNFSLSLIDGDSRTRLRSSWVSAPFFEIVGIGPQLGRVLDANDEAGNQSRVAVISDGFWKQHFGSDRRVVGRIIRVQEGGESSQRALEVVGVMPPGFDFPRGVDLWLPAAPGIRASAMPDPTNPDDVAWYLDHLRVFYALGRLREGASATQAEQELGRLIRQVEKDSPMGAPPEAVVTAIDDYLVGPAKPVLWTMFAGAVVMVLLACSSVAGLHLFRAARQDRAIAIQLALGATRSRLIRRSLVESAIIASAGAFGAVGIAWLATRALVLAAPLDVPRLATANVGAPAVLAVMVSLATLTALLSGVWPAVFIGHVDAGRTLTTGARTAMHPRERLFQRGVVGWQVAVAVVLLSGAALFVRSVQHLDGTPLGFLADGLVSVDLQPSATGMDGWDQIYDALRTRTEGLPHVMSTGAVSMRPLLGPIGSDTIPALKGQEGMGADAPWRRNARANLQSVTPGYFRTLGTRLLAGRDFTPDDRAASPNVVIVSASAAGRYWPGRNPIGELILVATQRTPGSVEQPRWQTVVGVVEDVRYRGITDPRLDLYLPAAQSTNRVQYLLVRTTATPAQVAADVRAIAHDLDSAVDVGETSAMTDVVMRETAPWRFAMRVLIAFGILAAALATAGLVGLVGLAVTLRRRELGIRAALGATPGRLRLHVLTETAWTAATATMVGMLAAVIIWRLADGLLVDTPPHDPLSIAGAGLLTFLAGIVGCMVPAARAAATDPAEGLRS